MNGDSELDPFTEALREDLPSARDEARLRVRLASAGILAGAGVMAPATTAAATGTATATAGAFAKLVALPLAVKVGAALALAGALVVPLVQRGSPEKQAPVETLPRAVATAALLPRTAEAPRRVEATAVPAEPKRDEVPRALVSGVGTPAPNRAAREVAPARVGSGTAPALSTMPAVAAFPAAPVATEDEGTLRVETVVMERALAAMKRGDFGTARRELALHAAQFPNGHLAPERDHALERIREKERTP